MDPEKNSIIALRQESLRRLTHTLHGEQVMRVSQSVIATKEVLGGAMPFAFLQNLG
jgi:hypothetical protein